MFIRLYELAKKENDDRLLNFCKEILEVSEKHGINDLYCVREINFN